MGAYYSISCSHFISYITFVGVVYRTDGDFTKAAVTMAVVDIVLVVVFIGSQMAKATAHKISKKIWLERIGICTSPIIFLVCMLPYFHFGQSIVIMMRS